MYKKYYFVFAALLVAGMLNAQETLVPTDSMGIHPWDGYENDSYIVRPEQSHWSIYLGAGFNIFDGDYTSEKKHGVWVPSASLGGAYHWNNTWSLGAEYKFRQFRVAGNEGHASVLTQGYTHQGNFYVAFDIFNAFRPQNKTKFFALDFILGGGAIWKKCSIYYPNIKDSANLLSYGTKSNDFIYKNCTATQTPSADEKYKVYGVFYGGISAEFNINRSLQLGLRGLYNYTTDDKIEGRPRGNNNDGFFDCEVILRYKFEPRQKSNVRNFMTEEVIGNWNKGTYYKNPEVGKAKRDKYDREHPQTAGAYGVCGSGQRDTLYIITRDTVYMMSTTQVVGAPVVVADKEIPDSYVVYFENNVPELDRTALSIASKAASDLNKFTDYYAVIVGSCDNTGAIKYNQWLAAQRAKNVTNTLVARGVNINRIYTVGRGIMQDDRAEGSYSVNRRVEIRIVTAEEFARAKEEYAYFDQFQQVEKSSAARQESDKYASSSEVLRAAIQNMKETGVAAPIGDIVDVLIGPEEEEVGQEQTEPINVPVEEISTEPRQNVTEAAAEEVQEPKVEDETEPVSEVEQEIGPDSDILDIVTVTPGVTLSKLARKYYNNNTNMWVKIFEANRDVIASPDHLEDGMKIVIPRL